jgi:hypothetical protein
MKEVLKDLIKLLEQMEKDIKLWFRKKKDPK